MGEVIGGHLRSLPTIKASRGADLCDTELVGIRSKLEDRTAKIWAAVPKSHSVNT